LYKSDCEKTPNEMAVSATKKKIFFSIFF